MEAAQQGVLRETTIMILPSLLMIVMSRYCVGPGTLRVEAQDLGAARQFECKIKQLIAVFEREAHKTPEGKSRVSLKRGSSTALELASILAKLPSNRIADVSMGADLASKFGRGGWILPACSLIAAVMVGPDQITLMRAKRDLVGQGLALPGLRALNQAPSCWPLTSASVPEKVELAEFDIVPIVFGTAGREESIGAMWSLLHPR